MNNAIPMLLKSYEGISPADGSLTLMFGLHKPDTDELVSCLAFADTPDGRKLIADPDLFRIGCAVGVYSMGAPFPIAFEFLKLDTTNLIAVTDVEAIPPMTEH